MFDRPENLLRLFNGCDLRDFSLAIPRWSAPRVHPNGPIQLDLTRNGAYRLHVWLREPLIQQKVHTPVHDHRFDMRSRVLLGTLKNEGYVFFDNAKDARDALWRVDPLGGDETVLSRTQRTGRAELFCEREIDRGRVYAWPAYVLHWAWPATPTAMTIVERWPRFSPDPAHVVVPVDKEPDNDFSRASASPSDLWPKIAEALHLARIKWELE